MADGSSQSPETAGRGLVGRWVEAHNSRDIHAMLACATEDVEFRPLRLVRGADSIYVGHDGLRLWLAQLERSPLRHELRMEQLREYDNNELLMVGSVGAPGSSTAEFYGIYDLTDGLIARAHHYISDLMTMEYVGLIRPAES